LIANIKHGWVLAASVLLIALVSTQPVFAQERAEHFESDVSTETKPWTHLKFFNDPKDFKFAIVSDRAGGVRPGVFNDAVRKLNLVMPEFVMSVGDFINGNTSDRAQLEKEWAEFDDELKDLKVPFFFVPGNHDINNDVQRDVWKERSGVPYYSFVYKNVLFLALDSTGEKGEIIPDAQVEQMKKALEKYPDVRWTFVFMHHPLWLYDSPHGFKKIEQMLEGRPHTVIAGHLHNYLHEFRNDTNYYILASTGGSSELRGPRYGEFDHVTLVTMTEDGPVMANLTLEGILPHDVTKRSDYEQLAALGECSELPYSVFADSEEAVSAATVYITFRNPSKREIQVRAKFQHGHEVRMEPSTIEMTMPPESDKIVEVNVESSEPISTKRPALLQLHWVVGYDLKNKDELFMSGTRDIPLRPSRMDLIRTVAPEFVDSLLVALADADPECTIRYTTDGNAPTSTSDVYEKPFSIDQATTVKARMFNKVGHGTATSQQTYKPVAAGKGMRYRVYHGKWTRMPKYSELKPVFESVTSDLQVESRQLRPDNWAMVLEGEFEIDRAGEYKFFLNSDDGSKLYIDDELVIDNDGDHSLLELTGSRELSAGKHRVRIEFFDAGAEAILELDLEGPGLERQPFPVEHVTH
jgi:hypothetical protein